MLTINSSIWTTDNNVSKTRVVFSKTYHDIN